MMGTFATLLAMSKVPTPEERYRADVTGDIENVAGVLKITRIHVHYSLKLKPEQRPAAEAAFAAYLPHCPAAQSVAAAINLEHRLEMQDL
ncbi:MAG: OsmC family protein [Desulfobacterales bacterium]|nr:OsmC family protein [Desulfobacterales bacterium]